MKLIDKVVARALASKKTKDEYHYAEKPKQPKPLYTVASPEGRAAMTGKPATATAAAKEILRLDRNQDWRGGVPTAVYKHKATDAANPFERDTDKGAEKMVLREYSKSGLTINLFAKSYAAKTGFDVSFIKEVLLKAQAKNDAGKAKDSEFQKLLVDGKEKSVASVRGAVQAWLTRNKLSLSTDAVVRDVEKGMIVRSANCSISLVDK
jgi:hypothetical protein